MQASFHPKSPFNNVCHPSLHLNSPYIPNFTCVKGANAETDSIELANTQSDFLFCVSEELWELYWLGAAFMLSQYNLEIFFEGKTDKI